MPNITRVQLAQSSSAVAAQSYTTAVQNPAWNCLIIASVKIFNATSGNLGTVTLSGNGLTWVEIGHVDSEVIATPTSRLFMFRALAPASGPPPTSGAVTITVSGTTNADAHWDFQEFHGINLSGTNGSGAIRQPTSNRSDSSTSITVTLPNPLLNAAQNVVFMGYAEAHGAQTETAGVGYTMLADLKDATNGETMATLWGKPGTTTPNMSDNGTATSHAGFAIEIVAAADPVIQTIW